MSANGRSTKYIVSRDVDAYRLCKILGLNNKGLCYYFGIGLIELELWFKKYPSFSTAIRNGKKDRVDYLKDIQIKKDKRSLKRKSKKAKQQNNKYMKNKYKEDIQYRLRSNMASCLRKKVKNKTSNGCFRHLGYTVTELITHLELKFNNGMTWDNYGSYWHIDHITPDSWFKYETEKDEEFKKSWSLDNLQPLLASENLKKGNRYAG